MVTTTFTHPNLGEIPLSLTELELNATQRLIESDVGRSTVLFRPPYFGDAEADKPQEVEPAIVAQNLGYIMVGVRIDPDDWQLPVTADQIVNRTIERATDTNPETRGEVVLLHDSGGDRSATIEALPRLIHELESARVSVCRCFRPGRTFKRSGDAGNSREPARVYAS